MADELAPEVPTFDSALAELVAALQEANPAVTTADVVKVMQERPRSPVPDYLLQQQREGIPGGGDTNPPPGPLMANALADIAGLGLTTAVGGPVMNALGRGVGAAWQGFSQLPAAAKFGAAALPALATPSEAGRDAKPKDYDPPGLASEIWSGIKNITGMGGPVDADRPMTQDQFRSSRRQLQPKSRSEYIESEVDKVRALQSYQEGGKNQRNNMESQARANAEKLYAGYQKDVVDEGTRIDREYKDYVAGWNQQRKEHLDKQFVERHPGVALGMTVGGPIASAVGARYGLKAINQKGADIAAAGEAARKAGNIPGLADAIVKADKYAPRAAAGRAAVLGEAALLPVEMRAMADFVDKKALPPDSGARKAAEDRMSLENTLPYLAGMAYDLGSGAIGTSAGALYNKIRGPSPGVDLAALRQHAAGIANRNALSQDQLSVRLMDRAKEAIAMGDELAALRAASNKPIPLKAEPAQPQLPPPASGQSQAGPVPPNQLAGPPRSTGNQPSAESGTAPQAPPTYKGQPLPKGVKLDSLGRPYRVKGGHKVRKDIFEGDE